jgi:2-amino-4-hydroxy-6-hydroxymethyldihydropteridine diphosphokinase
MPKIWISLGSNQQRELCLRTAIAALRKRYGSLLISPVYESAAIGFVGDPFYNLVVGCETDDSPHTVVITLRELETLCGRVRNVEKFSARSLDLDLLTWGEEPVQQDGIFLPRQEILQYAFVLRPLADVAGQELHPLLKQTYQALWAKFDQASQLLQPIHLEID